MNHVTRPTAIRLAQAGFPKPQPANGQIWYCRDGSGSFVVTGADGVGQRCDYQYIGSRDAPFIDRFLNDGEVFAPAATDILREIPTKSLRWNGSIWLCYYEEELGEPFYGASPAEACALAWLAVHAKTT